MEDGLIFSFVLVEGRKKMRDDSYGRRVRLWAQNSHYVCTLPTVRAGGGVDNTWVLNPQ